MRGDNNYTNDSPSSGGNIKKKKYSNKYTTVLEYT